MDVLDSDREPAGVAILLVRIDDEPYHPPWYQT